ncbi:hypothetical protein [Chryseobacterium culicis]|jgi:hypothetical protein|uniref:Bacteriocin-type signal sequence-containing protein n=1 Tax=Chryseobacterium culicis TaxID=680127 RepID=A0A1H6IHL5_CHRCI|nr:hypothetical protein [Chryseobacterium culicis]MBE4950635.1 hypothetical protein [Chryseobacterium culicis]SEH48328.1 hypothetical protein SAMN05421593_0001 [Chryseobacterium culicis]
MKNLAKISRERLKSLNGGAGPACLEELQFRMCYPPGWPNGICLSYYQCCVRLGGPIEFCKEEYGK